MYIGVQNPDGVVEFDANGLFRREYSLLRDKQEGIAVRATVGATTSLFLTLDNGEMIRHTGYPDETRVRSISFNGSDHNPLRSQNVTLPILGTSWQASGGVTGHPGALLSLSYGRTQPTAGIQLGAGQLLLDLTSLFLFEGASAPAMGTSLHSLPIPNDPGIVGLQAHVQAVIFGGGAELSNRLDVARGFQGSRGASELVAEAYLRPVVVLLGCNVVPVGFRYSDVLPDEAHFEFQIP